MVPSWTPNEVKTMLAAVRQLPRQTRAAIGAFLLDGLDPEPDPEPPPQSHANGSNPPCDPSSTSTDVARAADLLTIITATSPLSTHPSTDMLERAVGSLGCPGQLSGCRHLIVCDGASRVDAAGAARYAEYKQRLRALAAASAFPTNVEIVELQQSCGLPGVILAGVAEVRTPYLLIFDHDWEITRRIDVAAILSAFEEHDDVQQVRLNKRRTVEAGWDFVLKPDVRDRRVPLTRTGCWSGTPHFARLSHYRRMVVPRIRARRQGGAKGFEEPVDACYRQDIITLGFDRAQRKWGIFIYGLEGEPRAVRHLDGRGLDISLDQ